MRRLGLWFAMVWCVAIGMNGTLSQAAEAKNLLPNAAFEEGEQGTPAAWETQTWNGKAEFAWVEGGRSGKALKIVSTEGADAAWKYAVTVEPYAKYKLTAWVKTRNVQKGSGLGFLFNFNELQRQGITNPLVGDNNWTEISTEFETGDLDSLQVDALLGGWGTSTGTVWIDDVSLVQIGTSQVNEEPFIQIDATQIGEPISPYVYGQFIEHLGRCIYGGIWAEMLQDRKFYWPIGNGSAEVSATGGDGRATDRSPWSPIGDTSVKMVKEDAFVGEHSPKIQGGIQQSGLGVREGVAVVGRIWLKSDDECTVTLTFCEPDSEETFSIDTTSQYKCYEFHFAPQTTTQDGASLRIEGEDGKAFTIGTISLMPADHIDGLRADTLEELKKLDSPVYRWPGGNFVSGYNWKDGIGDRDRRPPRKNPAWLGVESNDMGIDEFIVFCRHLGTEPYIAVNSGLGGVESAVEEVEYCNGAADTPMGAWRAENGHAEPYAVKFWSIGNEMYGSWQLGTMPQSEYIVKHKAFYEAMRGVDPTIELIAVGAVGEWSENMMSQCADAMQMVSEHVYWQDRKSVLAHIRQATDSIRGIAAAHRSYRDRFEELKGKDIRICLDEWNYWYGPHYFGELGTRYFLKDGLGCAAALNEMFRNSDMYRMANYAQTVNVIGCIKTNTIHAALETTGLILTMYRHEYGTLPVATKSAKRFDVQAALTEDRSQLTISVVNPNGTEATLPLDLTGVKLAGEGKMYQLAGEDPMAYNDPEEPGNLEVLEKTVEVGDSLTVPAYSATIFVLEIAN